MRRDEDTRNGEGPLLVRALRGDAVERTPVWLMRQAGRTDPAYLAFREAHPLPLQDLFSSAEAAAQITLLPARLGVDALIVFQDILTPLGPMGAPFRFAPEPVIENPLDGPEALLALRPLDPAADMPHAAPLFRSVLQEADGLPVLGFAGAPLTLLAFLAEGRGFRDGIPRTRALLSEHPDAAEAVLGVLADSVAAWLGHQFDCGAAAVQLFESAAHLFMPEEYRRFALPFQQRVFGALRGRGTTIHFAHFPDAAPPPRLLADAGADVLSLPVPLSVAEARAELGANTVVQGNLDNQLLASGPLDAVDAAALECLRQGGGRGHVFNLGHGLLRETPHEHVVHLLSLVRSVRWDR
ncbi:MAG: uroporphyrinogen decarboxylase [Candidatus Hydrogenedentes bacterium]|nr:uroporphyrinogen decarboxylase [Candidatus Hydrogenedentota bacterium]